MRDILPELGPLLDGITVTDPDLEFDYVPYGPHFDPDRNVEDGHAVITARELTHPRRRNNIGGGSARGAQFVEIVAMFEDDEDISDMDTYKRKVREAIEAVIRANEHDFTDSFSVAVVDRSDPSDIIGSVLRNQVVVTVEAKTSETW